MKKRDIILITAILAAAFAMTFFVNRDSTEGESLRITVDGKEYGVYRLDRDQIIKINNTNTCKIQEGKVWMVRADCPDQIWVHHKPLDHTGGSIICLPNRVSMTIVNSRQTDTPDTIVS